MPPSSTLTPGSFDTTSAASFDWEREISWEEAPVATTSACFIVLTTAASVCRSLFAVTFTSSNSVAKLSSATSKWVLCPGTIRTSAT